MPKMVVEESLELDNGAVYTTGDTIEVFPNEAVQLLAAFPEHFTPVDFDPMDVKDPVGATFQLFATGQLKLKSSLHKKG